MTLQTEISQVDERSIAVRGHDLMDLMGSTSFAQMFSLMLLDRKASKREEQVIDALLIALVEHGITPTLPSRVIYHSAPESIHGAVAAALLSAGSAHLGTSEGCAQMLHLAVLKLREGDAQDVVARRTVEESVSRGVRIQGIGHRTHPDGDPRAVKLLGIAEQAGVAGVHCEMLALVSAAASERVGRPLKVNVTGAIAGIGLDLGLRWEVMRSFALIGRTLGAIAHINEEIERPMAPSIRTLVRQHVEYVGREAARKTSST